MGSVDPDEHEALKLNITTRLIFISKDQQAASVAAPFVTSAKNTGDFSNAAKQIAEWSIREVVNQVQ